MSSPKKSGVLIENYAANTDDLSHNVPQTVIEGLLAVAYVFILLIIVSSKRKVFRTAFFVMFVATGITDVISILISCFNRLNRQLSLSPSLHFLVSIAMILSGATFVSHMIGNMVIAINRYTALRFMKDYDKIWSGRNICVIIVIQYIVAVASFTHIIGSKVIYTQNSDGSFTFIGFETSTSWRNRFIFFGTSIIYAIASLILNVRLFIEWRKLSKLSGDSSSNVRNEKGLLLYTALVFFTTMLMCAQLITKAVAAITKNADLDLWATMQFYWVNDVVMCVPPFCLLMLSKDLRNEILNFFRCRRHQSSTLVPVSVLKRQSVVTKQ
nr:7TM GPCR domain containing protein [Haemonchus contortus]